MPLAQSGETMVTFTLPVLPYPYNALEPFIDEQTMIIHHTKHHQTYVDKLNAALDGFQGVEGLSIEQILRAIDRIPQERRQAVINHGGGHANHSLWWSTLGKNAGVGPSGALLEAINEKFGSFEDFKKIFTAAALGLFGSGWVWLCLHNDGQLHIHTTPNQNSPLMEGHLPILGLDVWEHNYYLKYANRRDLFVEAWWNVVAWPAVAARFDGSNRS